MLLRFRRAAALLVRGACESDSGRASMMKHVDGLGEAHRIDRAVGAAVVVLHDFENRGTAKRFQWFRRIVLLAVLREIQGETDLLPDALWKRTKVPSTAPDPPYPPERPRPRHR